MEKLYVCMTYYHVLITLIKALTGQEKIDIMISNDIPDVSFLIEKLRYLSCFDKIIILDEINIQKRRMGKKDLIYYLTDKYIINSKFYEFCKLDFKKYQDIYLYHDMSSVGKYFLINHIQYHLIEDALDYFKYFDKYYRIDEGSYKKGTLKFFLKEKFGIGYKMFGSSEDCIDIEVNELDGVLISKDKCFELPRKQLFGLLSEEQKIIVFNAFAAGKEINGTKEKTAIICTQPLYKDSFVNTEEEQVLVFRNVIKEYVDSGYKIVIKPHPRDMINYKILAKEFNCDLIDKNLPSEILNYNPEAKYDVAVSITSTAINFLQYAKEKRFMGREYIAEALGNENHSKEKGGGISEKLGEKSNLA